MQGGGEGQPAGHGSKRGREQKPRDAIPRKPPSARPERCRRAWKRRRREHDGQHGRRHQRQVVIVVQAPLEQRVSDHCESLRDKQSGQERRIAAIADRRDHAGREKDPAGRGDMVRNPLDEAERVDVPPHADFGSR